DSSSYALAPDGGFENGGAGWTMAGGASVQGGNSSYYVRSRTDNRMLTVPAGASATTPGLCIDATMPPMRLFGKTLGAQGASLSVDALYTDSSGVKSWHALGVEPGSTAWSASKVLRLPTVIRSPQVQFRFTSKGGAYQLDDLYIDPYVRT